MAKLNIPPTKSSLMHIKSQLSVAKEGFELLEQKREILVMELMKRVEQVKILEREMDKRIDTAYDSLKKMLLHIGRETSTEISKGIKFDYQFRERSIKLIGIELPSIDVDMPKIELKYSFLRTFAYCDKTMIEFFELLKIIAEMAGIRTIIWRLANEVRKTQRRVNALEKVVIPDNEETGKYIESILEERDREAFFVMKMLKAKMQKKEQIRRSK